MLIGDLANKAAIPCSTIRFWEDQKILPKCDRGSNGYREYGTAAVERVMLIVQAKKLGFTLKELRGVFSADRAHTVSCVYAAEILQQKLAQLDQHILQAHAVRREILSTLSELRERSANSDTPESSALLHSSSSAM
jgi:DNA-binding transcriptional MerR regulator